MMTNKELVVEFAKAWNNLDIKYIQELLIDDFHYGSQWVLEEIENKVDYLKFLKNKFSSISKSDSQVTAELGQLNKDFCLIINQVENDNDNKVTFLIQTENGKVSRADTCIFPNPRRIKRLNIIPK